MHDDPSEVQTPGTHAETIAPSESTPTPVAVAGVVRKPKKKRKYSKGLKELQQFGRSMNKASTRVVRAVAKGMTTYRKRSNRSALKKRDGALRDLGLNLAEGLGKTMRELSDVPSDLAKAMNGPRARKRMRRQVRATARLLRPLR